MWQILFGGGLTLLGSISGAVLAHYLTAQRDEARYRREELDRRDRDLRAAYADWMAASQKAFLLITVFQALPEDKRDGSALVMGLNAEIGSLGSRVRLLETDAEGRRRTSDTVVLLANLGATLATAPPDFSVVLREVNAAGQKLGELERWVLQKRFPLPTSAL